MAEGNETRRVADCYLVVAGGFAFVTALVWGAATARIGRGGFEWPMSPVLWLSLFLVAAGALSLARAARPPWWLLFGAALLAGLHVFVYVSWCVDVAEELPLDPLVTLAALITALVVAARLRPAPTPGSAPERWVQSEVLGDPTHRRLRE